MADHFYESEEKDQSEDIGLSHFQALMSRINFLEMQVHDCSTKLQLDSVIRQIDAYRRSLEEFHQIIDHKIDWLISNYNELRKREAMKECKAEPGEAPSQ